MLITEQNGHITETETETCGYGAYPLRHSYRCVDFEEEGDLDIWEQENEMNSHNPDQYLQEYIQ